MKFVDVYNKLADVIVKVKSRKEMYGYDLKIELNGKRYDVSDVKLDGDTVVIVVK